MNWYICYKCGYTQPWKEIINGILKVNPYYTCLTCLLTFCNLCWAGVEVWKHKNGG